MKITTVDDAIEAFRDGQNIFRRPSVELLVREIERLKTNIGGILSVLREVVDEATTQDAFSGDESMYLLHTAKKLLEREGE